MGQKKYFMEPYRPALEDLVALRVLYTWLLSRITFVPNTITDIERV
jgi:hypothetical protein